MVKVLFVCTGNICRSPTAEGVFRALVEREGLGGVIGVDSAATHGYHVGEPPDPRTCEAAGRRGVDLTCQRARQVSKADFDAFDLVLAMDRGHHGILSRLCPPGREGRLHLFLSFAPESGALDVPDPYYGGPQGFETVLDLIEAGSAGLLAHIRREML
ncbi:MAG: low molecular weight protein-tyrosine-phosphatase [Actinomycetota bacterium]